MSQFFKFVFASCLGVILASVVVVGIAMAMASSLMAESNKKDTIGPNTVLKLSFEEPVPEKANNIPIDFAEFKTKKTLGLQDIKQTLEAASKDNNIKGIFMDLSSLSLGRAKAGAVRDAILKFKESGKFVVSYGQYYSQSTYYLASAADKVYVNPIGGVDFRGFSAQILFFKDMLDRLGVNMQIYYAGQFKSATEPFRLRKMSEQNRLQVREYLDGMYEIYLQDISDSRGIAVPELKKIANELLLRDADDAVKYNMADAKGYRDEVYSYLREKLGFEEDDKLKFVSINEYEGQANKEYDYSAKDKIAVVYAEGNIVDGDGDLGSVGGDKYASILRKIRRDDNIKAIVMRINSPGGSALASDIMWRELSLAKEAGKPVIASMGDLAASGGYYLACVADSIYAEPSTITGSIGVFGMIPSLQKMMDEKLGVTMDTVKTGKFSVGLNTFLDIDPEEGKIIQSGVEDFYEIFLKRVADGRKMSRDDVHKVAQGRVWTGEKAKQIGLVDHYGGLDEAVATAARMAGLTKYRTKEYPRIKEPIEQLIEELTNTGTDRAQTLIREELGELYPFYHQLRDLQDMKGIQAKLPFMLEIQ
ncbi:MAG: signal peptide peptidase SppA [Bacteroidota bacterium]